MTSQKKQTPQHAAFNFFLEHAGYSYNPKTETPKQGRAKCARKLAKAERDAKALGYRFVWEGDWTLVHSHDDEYGSEAYPNGDPDTCESCTCFDSEGKSVASLGCIDDATPEYRRVIEAELAMEALAGMTAKEGR